jgi:hypothetical protein
MNSTPADSRARRIAKSFAAVIEERRWDQKNLALLPPVAVALGVLYMIQKLNKGREWLGID